MKKFKEINALGEWVVLRAAIIREENKKTETGLLLPGKQANGQNVNNPNSNGKVAVNFYVHKIGEKAQGEVTYKVGDHVIINDYDAQIVANDEEELYCLCHYKNVKASVID